MRFISRKQLSRRTVLKGFGAGIALPLLDAMTPALASAAAKKAPTRLSFVYVPNGIIMADWTPKATGKGFEFTRILKPLEPFRDDLLVLSGLADKMAMPGAEGAGDHARAGASYLTGVRPKRTAGADIQGGISADQIAARVLGEQTRVASIELGCDDARTVGNCDAGYSCAYANSISWRTPSTPMPPEVNPRVAFERLFGTEDFDQNPEARARRADDRRSILDLVQEDTRKLVKSLGAADRRKIDEYLTAVREIEQRIQRAEQDDRELYPTAEKPAGIPVGFDDYLRLMYDLQLLAFQTDVTRVASLMVGREGSNRVYPEIGVPDPHHPITHHRDDPEWVEKVTRINCYHVQMFAQFLEKLKSTPDGDGTLLDHTLIVYGSGLSDGNRHSHENLPVLLVGRNGGRLKAGRHIVYRDGTPTTNLYLSVLDLAGVPTDAMGDSSGKLEYLTDL